MTAEPFRKALPDGRVVYARRLETDPQGRVFWECWIRDEEATNMRVGWPLEPTLAALLGYDVAHEEWPDWIGVMASELDAASVGEQEP